MQLQGKKKINSAEWLDNISTGKTTKERHTCRPWGVSRWISILVHFLTKIQHVNINISSKMSINGKSRKIEDPKRKRKIKILFDHRDGQRSWDLKN